MARDEMPISIRGVTYANAREAAAAVGVTRSTIYSAIYRNTLDTVGLGTGSRKIWRGGRPKQVQIFGQSFRTLREASIFLGMKPGTLSSIMRRGGARSKANVLRILMQKTAEAENAAVREHHRQGTE